MSTGYRALLAPGRRWLLAAAGGASFVAASDVLLVATALPSAARDLGGLDRYALVVGCYAAARSGPSPRWPAPCSARS